MPRARPASLTRRLAVTLTAVLLVDLLLVAVFVAPLSPVVSGVATAAGLPAVLVWAAVLACALGALVALQVRVARRAALSSVDVLTAQTDGDTALTDRVARLAQVVDMEPPAVGVVDSDVPNSFAVAGRDPTILVSRGLLERLEEDELDAVLAHELAHLRNRDATVLTLATFLPAVVSDDPVAGLPRWAGSSLLGGLGLFAAVLALSPDTAANPLTLVVTAALSVLVGGVALGVLATPMVYLSRRLSYDRELVADRAAARITGDPDALARALRRLDADTDSAPTTDLRSASDLLAERCLLPHGFEDGETEEAGRFTVRLRSHPPAEARIEHLQSVQADTARGPARQ